VVRPLNESRRNPVLLSFPLGITACNPSLCEATPRGWSHTISSVDSGNSPRTRQTYSLLTSLFWICAESCRDCSLFFASTTTPEVSLSSLCTAGGAGVGVDVQHNTTTIAKKLRNPYGRSPSSRVPGAEWWSLCSGDTFQTGESGKERERGQERCQRSFGRRLVGWETDGNRAGLVDNHEILRLLYNLNGPADDCGLIPDDIVTNRVSISDPRVRGHLLSINRQPPGIDGLNLSRKKGTRSYLSSSGARPQCPMEGSHSTPPWHHETPWRRYQSVSCQSTSPWHWQRTHTGKASPF